MNSLFEKYKKLPIDGGLIALEQRERIEPFFCYPKNAIPIGFEGCIMFCFIEGYGEMVFASNPESCTGQFVYPLSSSFADFICLILACGSANPIEQIIWMDKEKFELHLYEEKKAQTIQQKNLLLLLEQELNLKPMKNPYEYVHALQENFDEKKIKYGSAYYDALGIECPKEKC